MTNSNSLQMFSNPLFKVRVVIRVSKPWFVAKDVAECIDHKDVSTMCKLCRDNDKVVASARDFDSADLAESGNSRITLISESGLFRILAKSNLPKCEPFESWVFDEVLPSIRQKGYYSLQERNQEQEETHKNTLPAVSEEDHFFLKILHAESTEQTALAIKDYKTYRDDIQRKIEQKLDEAVRTKAYISQKRESTAMGKLGGTTKALNFEREKNTKLLKENIDLIKEKEDLKIRLQESDNYKTIRQMTVHLKKYIKTDTKSLQRLGKEMARISMEMSFKVIKVPDPLYEEVNSYHTEVWRETFAKLNNNPLFLIDIRK